MKITVICGDITEVTADAVVNAANSSLLGGGGVDGAIHAAAGKGLLAECEALRRNELPDGLAAGGAVLTKGHNLPANWIVHAVGPNRHAGETDAALLEAAFSNALHAADRIGANTVALPAIGAGAYGWEPADVAAAAHRALGPGTGERWDNLREVTFVVSGEDIADIFRAEFERPDDQI